MEELKYVIEDSTIAELLGVQNFSTDESAVLELVKNAYDANALSLQIKFENDNLYIFDDGDGMNADDIKRHWMHIGKSEKGYKIIDENEHIRVQAGSKGVGRFALSRLGRSISLITKKENEKAVKWSTDWNGSILDECKPDFEKGTHISIIGLRERWPEKRIRNLQKYLEKTYHDDAMKISINAGVLDLSVSKHFPEAKLGINCRSNIQLKYVDTILTVSIFQDEFNIEAEGICKGIDLHKHEVKIDMNAELKGSELEELLGDDLEKMLMEVGYFDANMFFNLVSTKADRDKFMYKYLQTESSLDSGIILYRNAFSISSYEGKKDWLGLGKRSRKSPAAASHQTGAWRVRENQLSGYVQIDKQENIVLRDLANRQGLDENAYYNLFVEIILAGIKEFERYRQSIIRKIILNNASTPKESSTPVSDKVIKNPLAVKQLSEKEAKQLKQELKLYKEEGSQYKKDKEEVEARYRYDVQILNVLATTGLKASSIAHEMKNDRNDMAEIYENIVEALKHYDMWDELTIPENRKVVYLDVPYMLERSNKVSQKIVVFMDTMLSEIEKKQFETRMQSVSSIIMEIKRIWERDYAWISIEFEMNEEIDYFISEDKIQVIFDNLILNSVQQNDNLSEMKIKISVKKNSGLLCFEYHDNGKGLDEKYKNNPRKILEVHETTRRNGHGLGMWIVNNTAVMSGGEVIDIRDDKGFYISFSLGGKTING